MQEEQREITDLTLKQLTNAAALSTVGVVGFSSLANIYLSENAVVISTVVAISTLSLQIIFGLLNQYHSFKKPRSNSKS